MLQTAQAAPAKKPTNPHRIRVADWRAQEGLRDQEAFLERLQELTIDDVAPAMCDEGCEVEPDGHCEHGCPSILLALGII